MASVYGSVYGVESSGGGVVPDAADVRFGTAVGATTGTLHVPPAASVLSGTPVDAGVGTYVVTAAGNVRSGTLFGAASAQSGTLVVPSLANTKVGVAGDGGTGTYDGSDRWSDPLASNVRLGVTYRANSTSSNRTGTLNITGGGETVFIRSVTKDLPVIAQGSAPTDRWTILDVDRVAVNLSGRVVRFVVGQVTDEGDEEDRTDDAIEALYQYESGDDANITIGGTDNNQVSVQHLPANTATAGAFRYWLWDVTTTGEEITLASGTFEVRPAAKSYP